MGSSNVNLSLGGCAANLQRRLQRGRDGRYANNSEYVAGNRNINGDSDYYGYPVPDIELSSESLGKHYRGHFLFRF